MERRSFGILISLVGVAFLVVVLGNGLFGASSSWENLSDDVRPVYTEAAIQQQRADAQLLSNVSEEFNTTVLPTIANALGVSEAELATQFAGSYPATVAGVQALPTIAEGQERTANLLASQQENFRSADAIPTADNSSVQVPWFITITGALAIVIGVAMLRPGKIAPVVAAVLGAVMLVVPLVTSLPSKASDADTLNEATAPLFSQANIDSSQAAITTLEAMAAELNTSLIPGLAQQLGLTPEQAQAFVAQNFPTIAGALQQFPDAIGRARTATALLSENLGEFADVRDVPNQAIAWTVVAGGIATMVLASISLATDDRMRRIEQERRMRRERAAA